MVTEFFPLHILSFSFNKNEVFPWLEDIVIQLSFPPTLYFHIIELGLSILLIDNVRVTDFLSGTLSFEYLIIWEMSDSVRGRIIAWNG